MAVSDGVTSGPVTGTPIEPMTVECRCASCWGRRGDFKTGIDTVSSGKRR